MLLGIRRRYLFFIPKRYNLTSTLGLLKLYTYLAKIWGYSMTHPPYLLFSAFLVSFPDNLNVASLSYGLSAACTDAATAGITLIEKSLLSRSTVSKLVCW
jgi:hypothetical protein